MIIGHAYGKKTDKIMKTDQMEIANNVKSFLLKNKSKITKAIFTGDLFNKPSRRKWDIFYDSFERGRTTGSLLDLPSWIAELPVPTLFAMLAIQAIIEIWKLLTDQPIPEGETQ